MSRQASFFHWPGLRQLGYALLLSAAEMALFILCYGGADWFAGRHQWRVAVHCPLDLAMPLWPPAIFFYVSLNPLLWMAPFVLRTTRELKAMAASLAVATVVAAFVFVALPAKEVFSTAEPYQLGIWAPWFDTARAMALRNNYLPSLHVAFTTICAAAYADHASPLGRILLWSWAGAIMASTLLTHQHYLADVATGFVLGLLAIHWIYRDKEPHDLGVPAGDTRHEEF
jgi:membrane-associated phospholipid phosphatase